MVEIVPGTTNPVAVRSFEADHRVGAGAFSTVTILASERFAKINGYVEGQLVEIRARAISLETVPSAYTLSQFHTVATSLPIGPVVEANISYDAPNSTATLTWRAPNETNFGYAKVLRNTVNDINTATEIAKQFGAANQSFIYADSGLGAGPYYYWIAVYTFLDEAGPPVGALVTALQPSLDFSLAQNSQYLDDF
jgi:hypothetical protein